MLAVNDAVHVVKDMGLASLAMRMYAVNDIAHVARDRALAPLVSLAPLTYVGSEWSNARGQRYGLSSARFARSAKICLQ